MPISSQFLEGPAGTGKTSQAIQYLHNLAAQEVLPQSILILVPQKTLGRPYQLALSASDWPNTAGVDIVTIGGLVQRSIQTFWPLVASSAGFTHHELSEPTFLTIETAQYYMAKFVDEAVNTGRFDSVSIPRSRLIAQSLDNMTKAAINSFTIDDVAERLTRAWGGHSSRLMVYQTWREVAHNFRQFCLENNLLDFSLQMEVFTQHILKTPQSAADLSERYKHLIADNIEENSPIVTDFIKWLWPFLESAFLIYDSDAGYRIFLGAEPKIALELKSICTDEIKAQTSHIQSPALQSLEYSIIDAFDQPQSRPAPPATPPHPAIEYEFLRFYPQMIDWACDQIIDLIQNQGVQPRDIVLIAPFLNDSLRFSLINRFEKVGIPFVSHRPSRPLREEPAARAMLTMMQLVNPTETQLPPAADFSNALVQIIGIDPIRARLLTEIVYGVGRSEPTSFDQIHATMQERITYSYGNHYEQLRLWLLEQRALVSITPPDYFLRDLFGNLASQPGFGFSQNLDAGTIIGQMVDSAYTFRNTLYPNGIEDWSDLWKDYRQLLTEGLLAASHPLSWQKEESNAVFIAPAYTYLVRNRPVDYQFWLDVGSQAWAERLEQPLTHPYVLRRNYPLHQLWTDDDERESNFETLYKLVLGLVRRCRKQIYLGIADLGEQGFEQRGPLLHLFQLLLRPTGEDAA